MMPALNSEKKANLEKQLRKYAHVVSTLPWKDAWIIDGKQIENTIHQSEAKEWQ